MSHTINLPDVGDLDGVEIVEISVKPGDSIEQEQTILTLEGSKASMEIPAPESGVVEKVLVNVGDAATDSMPLIVLSSASEGSSDVANQPKEQSVSDSSNASESAASNEKGTESTPAAQSSQGAAEKITFNLPDVGDLDGVEIVEISVKPGDSIEQEQTILTLEGSKASMEIPSPYDGVIEEILVKVGDAATDSMALAIISTQGSGSDSSSAKAAATSSESAKQVPATAAPSNQTSEQPPAKQAPDVGKPPAAIGSSSSKDSAHASPSIRKFARKLGVDLSQVQGTGEKNRISKEDIEKFVKAKMQSGGGASSQQAATGSGIPSIPKIDFSKFGEIEYQKLGKIKQVSSSHLHASWLNIPHVTQFTEVNAESLESYRQAKKTEIEKQGYKLTPLVLIMKAITASLKEFPTFNSSFVDGQLVLKKYYNIGIAVDTSDGLVVPVVRNVDEKSVFALAKELAEISQKARDKKLTVTDMSGGTFTISNLGGLGAGPFTPIVNAPEVAILGLSKSFIKPVFSSGYFMPQLTMPLSLSYDHRVIDGADGARFMAALANHFLDISSVL